MDNSKSFVCTSDEETRQKLLKLGLNEISNSNGVYTFINKDMSKISQFSAIDNEKLRYTNTLCI